MPSDPHHKIIAVRLLTTNGVELEPAPEIHWRLDMWKMRDLKSEDDRVIGPDAVIDFDDPDFRSS